MAATTAAAVGRGDTAVRPAPSNCLCMPALHRQFF